MQYDAGSEKLYYHVGGAITYDSNGEEELAECMHKAAGMLAALRD
jgi:anthranilate/para-aminobenzoate synthase component I